MFMLLIGLVLDQTIHMITFIIDLFNEDVFRQTNSNQNICDYDTFYNDEQVFVVD